MTHRPFVNGRDAESTPAFVLDIGTQIGRYTNSFTTGQTVKIPTEPEDTYAVFLPTPGVNFLVGGTIPFDLIPVTVDGMIVTPTNVVQNPAVINLKNSGLTELWVKSDTPQTLTVLLYS